LGFFTEDLYCHIVENKKDYLKYASIFPVAIVLVIFISYYPLVLGKSIQNETWYGDSRYSLFVKVPSYWKDLRSWVESHSPNTRLLAFPRNYYGMTYNWESGASFAGPAVVPLLPNPIIMHPPRVPTSEQNRMASLIYQSLYLGEGTIFFPYLDLFNIGYVLQQNDASFYNEAGVFDPLIMNKILGNQNYLKKEAGFGRLEFISQDKGGEKIETDALTIFSVQRNNSRKFAYSPKELIFVSGRLEDYWDIFSFSQYHSEKAYYFSDDQSQEIDQESLSPSRVFVNLKTSLEGKNEDGGYTYKFSVPLTSSFKLLVNNYLLGKQAGDNSKTYYLRLDGNHLNELSSIGGWQGAGPLLLTEGTHVLETNLLVEIIKSEYITSPFWIVEEKEVPQYEGLKLLSEKINPAKYKIEISNYKDDFVLILNESFHWEWKVYYKNQRLDLYHFLANGYANGWILPKDKFGENEKINLEIRYYPQEVAQKAAMVSVSFIFVIIAYLTIDLLGALVKKKEL